MHGREGTLIYLYYELENGVSGLLTFQLRKAQLS